MHTRLTVASRRAAPLSDVVGLSAAAAGVGRHRRTKGLLVDAVERRFAHSKHESTD